MDLPVELALLKKKRIGYSKTAVSTRDIVVVVGSRPLQELLGTGAERAQEIYEAIAVPLGKNLELRDSLDDERDLRPYSRATLRLA